MASDTVKEVVKLRAGKFMVKCTLTYSGNRIFCSFPYNKPLMAEIKAMKGAKYHGYDEINPRKIWSIAICQRNMFRLAYMQGENVYEHYDKEIIPYTSERPLYLHQLQMVAFGITRRRAIIVGEMGTGKTLAMIEIMEYIKLTEGLTNFEAWYVGPKSGVRAVGRELIKWTAQVRPIMHTYESFTKEIQNWNDSKKLPKVVFFDESSKLKTPTSQRSQAAEHLTESMKSELLGRATIMLMTGTPAPKNPCDWWMQAEIACPGFLKEGHIAVLKKRLSLTEERESPSGGVYPHIITWLDDSSKCAICGEKQDHPNHDETSLIFGGDKTKIHDFKSSINEVSKLYTRLKGLVDIYLKAECTDLPDKQYRVIKVMPTQETLRAAKLIKAKAPRVITAFTLLRELSDGFQYAEEVVGEDECPECFGEGIIEDQVPISADILKAQNYDASNYKTQEMKCYCCSGKGTVPRYKRITESYSSPKDDVFIDLLDEYSELGRFVVWGGFTGTIERLLDIAHQQGWCTLRYDKIVHGSDPEGNEISVDDLLDAMDNSHPRYEELREAYPRVCFVGHPDAGGMALTLHASPVALYYSNSFKGESRIQSEDRIHRLGMDNNRGCTIIDLIHLQSDLQVLDNLKQKKKLQNLTMDVLDDAFVSSDINVERYES